MPDLKAKNSSTSHMKVCFFTENYHKGGLDTFLINLFNAWPNPADELTLICNATHPGLETIITKVIRQLSIGTYTRLFTSRISKGLSSSKVIQSRITQAIFTWSFRLIQYPVLLPWYVLSLTWYFHFSDFNRLMVVNGGYPASLLCRCASIAWRLSGKRRLATFNFHNSTTRPPWYFSIPEYLIDCAVIWSSSQMVSVSMACLNTLNSRKAFDGYVDACCIYNGIEVSGLLPKVNKAQPGDQNPAEVYCLMLATYEPRKGHVFLLQAFETVVQEFPDVHLKIHGFGTPSEKQKVADEIAHFALENRVSLNDFVLNAGSLIENAAVLVVPSQSYESFGLTIIEAMALGTPVVTTDVGGMPEVLADSHAGFVCSRNDPVAFANAIKCILRDPALASDLGRNGRRAFEQRFTASRMAQQYESIINDSRQQGSFQSI